MRVLRASDFKTGDEGVVDVEEEEETDPECCEMMHAGGREETCPESLGSLGRYASGRRGRRRVDGRDAWLSMGGVVQSHARGMDGI